MENYLLISMFVYLTVVSFHHCIIQDPANEKRYKDKSFPNHTLVYNKTISCGKHNVGLFPAQTWTCANIRVDGMRLAYGLYPGLGVDNKCTETKGFDDVTEICLVMMGAIEIKNELWAALVTNATCDYINETRLLLNQTFVRENADDKDDNVTSKSASNKKRAFVLPSSVKTRPDPIFQWHEMGPGHGWVHTIQCMAMRDKNPHQRVVQSFRDHTEL